MRFRKSGWVGDVPDDPAVKRLIRSSTVIGWITEPGAMLLLMIVLMLTTEWGFLKIAGLTVGTLEMAGIDRTRDDVLTCTGFAVPMRTSAACIRHGARLR